MHVTLFLCASTGSVQFKFGFDFFETFCMSGFFLFSVFFKVNSGVFLRNRVATLNVMQLSKLLLTGYQFSSVRIPIEHVVMLPGIRLAVL